MRSVLLLALLVTASAVEGARIDVVIPGAGAVQVTDATPPPEGPRISCPPDCTHSTPGDAVDIFDLRVVVPKDPETNDPARDVVSMDGCRGTSALPADNGKCFLPFITGGLFIRGVTAGAYLGSGADEQGNGIAVASDGSIHVIGSTQGGFPTVNPVQPGFGGGQDDAFVVKLANTGAGLSGSWRRATQRCKQDDETDCVVRGVLRVHNPGTATTATSIIRFFLSTDETLDDGDRPLEEAVLQPLRAGRTRSKIVRVELEASVGGQHLIAVLDAVDTVPEADESNNVVVSPAVPPQGSNAG